MTLLGTYSTTASGGTCRLDFEIPKNTTYITYVSATGENCVEITLPLGEQPATSMNPCSEEYNCEHGVDIMFIQKFDNEELKKPTITISV